MPRTYEYLLEDFLTSTGVAERLNELGAEGWALNSFFVLAGTGYRAIFMRETTAMTSPPPIGSLPPDILPGAPQAAPDQIWWGWRKPNLVPVPKEEK